MSQQRDLGRGQTWRAGKDWRRASWKVSILCEGAMKTLSEDRRLADATRFCIGQRGAATTTEGVRRRHRFRVGRMASRGQGCNPSVEGLGFLQALRKLY